MNILITGASGYLGSILLEKLEEYQKESGKDWNLIAADIREPKANIRNLKYIQLDVRAPNVEEVMKEYNIDTVVHLASIVTPGKQSNREFEYSVDVLGTENILKACVDTGVKRIILTSSGAAYGYHPDNPTWLMEEDAIRGNKEFAYSYHKRLVEELCEKYRRVHPELEQVIFRIGTILGDSTNNQITNLFHKKAILGISGSSSPFVFVWDRDVAACLLQAIIDKKTGIYNVAGDGSLNLNEIGGILKKRVIYIPAFVLKIVLFILKRLSLTQYGEEQVNFLRYRPVLCNEKLKKEFGYRPKLSSKETFLYYLDNREKGNALNTNKSIKENKASF